MTRLDGRPADAVRPTRITPDFTVHAEGSVLIEVGRTKVICTASIEDRVPPFLRGAGKGWVTAEYGMLPRATDTRTDREAARGKQTGRTQEIQRLIGRSLRAVTDLTGFGERQIRVDCDVLQADGGTRTAAISGGYVALHLAFDHMRRLGAVSKNPLREAVAAVSCGLYEGQAVLDLDYAEDSQAEADANFVMTASGGLVEIQATAEKRIFARSEMTALMDLAEKGIAELVQRQREALRLT